jgi:hypothetical protein
VRGRASAFPVWTLAVALATGLIARPVDVLAQTPVAADGAAGDLTYLSVNAFLGGLTGGVTSAARGGPFLRAFAHGALGGAASYAGKRLSGSTFWGAGFVGRQVAAAGASVVRSSAFGDQLLDTLFLPVGPGRLHVPIGSGAAPGYRIDLEELGWLAYSVSRAHLSLDVGRSLSSGAFVFVGDERLRGEHDNALGRAAPGLISIRSEGPDLEATLAHEQVHIAQLDHLKIVWGLPLEGWLRQMAGERTDSWTTRFESGVGHYPMLWLLTTPWSEHDSRPLEREAEYIESLHRSPECPGGPDPGEGCERLPGSRR